MLRSVQVLSAIMVAGLVTLPLEGLATLPLDLPAKPAVNTTGLLNNIATVVDAAAGHNQCNGTQAVTSVSHLRMSSGHASFNA